jgi:hypothetical protein
VLHSASPKTLEMVIAVFFIGSLLLDQEIAVSVAVPHPPGPYVITL